MKAVIQRVSEASVLIDGTIKRSIGKGLMVLFGVPVGDDDSEIDWLVKKITQLRIFDDKEGVMNLSVKDIEGEILVISQFTLYAHTKKGNRPSYIQAAKPPEAIPIYEKFVNELSKELSVKTGEFGADMKVNLTNDGPVTLIIDTHDKI